MLKKLVKYGNSNALIFDKAILELLDIEEGSILKIKTDGKSIIITPHVKTASEKVNETFTHQQAVIEANVKESLKKNKNVNSDKQEQLEKEWLDLIEKQQNISNQLFQNPEFCHEVKKIAKEMDITSLEYIKAYNGLRYKFSPESSNLDKEIAAFENRNKLGAAQSLNEEQQNKMQQEFAAHFRKYSNVYKIHGELLENPEYQHEAQLIAEKYNFNKNSQDFISEIDKLTYKYLPELKQAKEEMLAISEKCSKINNK